MEDLELNCKQSSSEGLAFTDKWENILVNVNQDFNKSYFVFGKEQARQLHEWLGRYLENSDG